MTMMTTIVAVALGIVPVSGNGYVAPASASDASLVGNFRQSLDSNGNTRLRGFAGNSGRPFNLVVEPDGDVHGVVGDVTVEFNARAVD
jgi:hypothetical protein